MANRFWVGGTGNWSDNTNHWSASSGGSPGASLPTNTDNVIVDSNSGISGGTIFLDTAFGTGACQDFTSTTGVSYTMDALVDNLNVYGSLTLESGFIGVDFFFVYFFATTTGKTITMNGCTLNDATGGMHFFGSGGGWTLQDNLSMAGELRQDDGTLNANNKNVTAKDFYFFANTGSNPVVNMGTGTWLSTGDSGGWTIDENGSGTVTVNPSTSTIKFTGNTPFLSTINSATGKTYNNFWFAGSGDVIIEGSNTFNDFKDTNNTGHSIIVANSTTNTINTFSVNSGKANGADLITNGNFTGSATGWTLQTFWTYTSNHVHWDTAATSINYISQNIGAASNTLYKVTFDTSVSTQVLILIGTTVGGSFNTTVAGTNHWYLTSDAASDGNIYIYGHDGGYPFDLDNVKVEKFNMVRFDSDDSVTPFTFAKSSGFVSTDYLDISNSTVTGVWYAGNNSLNTTNNSGWKFFSPGNMFSVF